jgi:hypothetical protein
LTNLETIQALFKLASASGQQFTQLVVGDIQMALAPKIDFKPELPKGFDELKLPWESPEAYNLDKNRADSEQFDMDKLALGQTIQNDRIVG